MKRKRRHATTAADVSGTGEVAPKAARKRKKRRTPAASSAKEVERKAAKVDAEEEEEDLDDDEDEDDDDGKPGVSADSQDLELDFDFREPDEADFHAVKDLLRSGTWEFIGDSFNYSELADSVVNQGNIGTIIKSSRQDVEDDDDETSCGILTALNLRQFKHLSWAKAIQSTLLAKASQHASAEVSQAFKDLLAKQGKGVEVGILFNERFVNVPGDVIPPLHKMLREEIEWSCSTPECPEEERPFYFFTHFIGVAKCYLSSDIAAKAGFDVGSGQESGPFFQFDEFEAYARKATSLFTFPVAKPTKGKKSASGPPAPDGRAVFIINRKAFEQVGKALNKSVT
eukprot:CAMPEP_0169210684 /NCGR_PEP_ID=MMETSP1016-20121227/15349_1 /TAXON_ID=342587 /ORGANISM="Karlodinium micrum, Strain CCMP2283" /LENGTH=341 /DNA_ID=CAMNT_0009288247 /DNA_START=333 /DNA_END=1358 /DNA_ORIENTATION=+